MDSERDVYAEIEIYKSTIRDLQEMVGSLKAQVDQYRQNDCIYPNGPRIRPEGNNNRCCDACREENELLKKNLEKKYLELETFKSMMQSQGGASNNQGPMSGFNTNMMGGGNVFPPQLCMCGTNFGPNQQLGNFDTNSGYGMAPEPILAALQQSSGNPGRCPGCCNCSPRLAAGYASICQCGSPNCPVGQAMASSQYSTTTGLMTNSSRQIVESEHAMNTMNTAKCYCGDEQLGMYSRQSSLADRQYSSRTPHQYKSTILGEEKKRSKRKCCGRSASPKHKQDQPEKIKTPDLKSQKAAAEKSEKLAQAAMNLRLAQEEQAMKQASVNQAIAAAQYAQDEQLAHAEMMAMAAKRAVEAQTEHAAQAEECARLAQKVRKAQIEQEREARKQSKTAQKLSKTTRQSQPSTMTTRTMGSMGVTGVPGVICCPCERAQWSVHDVEVARQSQMSRLTTGTMQQSVMTAGQLPDECTYDCARIKAPLRPCQYSSVTPGKSVGTNYNGFTYPKMSSPTLGQQDEANIAPYGLGSKTANDAPGAHDDTTSSAALTGGNSALRSVMIHEDSNNTHESRTAGTNAARSQRRNDTGGHESGHMESNGITSRASVTSLEAKHRSNSPTTNASVAAQGGGRSMYNSTVTFKPENSIHQPSMVSTTASGRRGNGFSCIPPSRLCYAANRSVQENVIAAPDTTRSCASVGMIQRVPSHIKGDKCCECNLENRTVESSFVTQNNQDCSQFPECAAAQCNDTMYGSRRTMDKSFYSSNQVEVSSIIPPSTMGYPNTSLCTTTCMKARSGSHGDRKAAEDMRSNTQASIYSKQELLANQEMCNKDTCSGLESPLSCCDTPECYANSKIDDPLCDCATDGDSTDDCYCCRTIRPSRKRKRDSK